MITMTLEEAQLMVVKMQVALAEMDAAVNDGDIDDDVYSDLEDQCRFLENLIEDTIDE